MKPEPHSSIIDIEGVEHWFAGSHRGDAVKAVDKVNLRIMEGEFVAIVGPSGCGKTTLLNLVAGLDKPTRGKVRVSNLDVTGVQPRLIGYMVSQDTLLPWRTALANVEFGLANSKSKEAKERAKSCLDLVGLQGFENHYPDQLSHGMKQRVALARTLVGSPKILLMDEPFGALDAQTKLLLAIEFLHIWETERKTIAFVTHDLSEAIAMADRVIVMSARPCRIVSEYRIGLDRPRDLEALRSEPEFVNLLQKLWIDLKRGNVKRAIQ